MAEAEARLQEARKMLLEQWSGHHSNPKIIARLDAALMSFVTELEAAERPHTASDCRHGLRTRSCVVCYVETEVVAAGEAGETVLEKVIEAAQKVFGHIDRPDAVPAATRDEVKRMSPGTAGAPDG